MPDERVTLKWKARGSEDLDVEELIARTVKHIQGDGCDDCMRRDGSVIYGSALYCAAGDLAECGQLSHDFLDMEIRASDILLVEVETRLRLAAASDLLAPGPGQLDVFGGEVE